MKSSRDAMKVGGSAKHDLIVDNHKFVHNIVLAMAKRYKMPSDTIDDYISAGYLGLVEAADRYQSDFGEFTTFAFLRVRGAIIDAIRKNADLGRDAYQAAKVAAAINEIEESDFVEAGLGVRIPDGKKGERLARLLNVIAKGAIIQRLGNDESEDVLNAVEDESQGAEEKVIQEEQLNDLERIIKRLPKEERRVIIDYYYKDLTFTEILNDQRFTTGRTKSWLSKTHSRALENLRGKLDRLNAKREKNFENEEKV